MCPRYPAERPLDSTLLKAKAGFDSFITERHADELAGTLTQWSQAIVHSPHDLSFLLNSLAADFTGASPVASESRRVRTQPPVEVHQKKFAEEIALNREAFLRALQSSLRDFSEIDAAELQITSINASPVGSSSDAPVRIETRIRYEIAGTGEPFHRDQRVGNWQLVWKRSEGNGFRVATWRTLDETQARAASPIYADITAAALGHNSSY